MEEYNVDSFLAQLHDRANTIPGTPAVKRLKTFNSTPWINSSDPDNNIGEALSNKFAYKSKSRPWKSIVKEEIPEQTTGGLSFSNWHTLDLHANQSAVQQQKCKDQSLLDIEESDDEYPNWNCLDSVDTAVPKDHEEKSLCNHLSSSKCPKSADSEKNRKYSDTLVVYDTILKPNHNKPVIHKNQHERHRAQEVVFSDSKTCTGKPSFFQAPSVVRSLQGTEDSDVFMDIFQGVF